MANGPGFGFSWVKYNMVLSDAKYTDIGVPLFFVPRIYMQHEAGNVLFNDIGYTTHFYFRLYDVGLMVKYNYMQLRRCAIWYYTFLFKDAFNTFC